MNSIEFKTGDLLLVHGTDNCLSNVIEYFTGSDYSHVAMIIKDPTFLEGGPREGLFVIESGIEESHDVEDNKIKLGVQVQELDKVLEEWEGDIFYRLLDCDRSDPFCNKLEEIHRDVHDKPYDLLPLDWIRSEFDIERSYEKTHRTNTFWCSALVAYIYAKLGLIDEETAWTLVRPKDFGTKFGYGDESRVEFKCCYLHGELPLPKN
jgi:cell wall-associated NlpC family hydrolase